MTYTKFEKPVNTAVLLQLLSRSKMNIEVRIQTACLLLKSYQFLLAEVLIEFRKGITFAKFLPVILAILFPSMCIYIFWYWHLSILT